MIADRLTHAGILPLVFLYAMLRDLFEPVELAATLAQPLYLVA
ncbi:MAG: hypothetical protein AAFQ35_05915 [Pseudomonadota bacterium]